MRQAAVLFLVMLCAIFFLLSTIAHSFGRTTASYVLSFLLGLVGLILGAAAIGVWLT